MNNFYSQDSSRRWTLERINDAAKVEPEYLINSVESHFHIKIGKIIDYILNEKENCKLILISGPSSSGKTTFSNMIIEKLKENGVWSDIFSFDNFYRGFDHVPELEDGSKDFEAIDGLDTVEIKKSLTDLIEHGECTIPTYDFAVMAPKKERLFLKVPKRGIIIAEGLHAINPVLTEGINSENVVRIYVDLKVGIRSDDSIFFPTKFVRLTRRVLRDYIHRGTDAERTILMWKNIIRGEKLYIRPIRQYADIKVNTLHSYEPCVMAKETLKLMKDLPGEMDVKKFVEKLSKFEYIDKKLVPKNSLIQEFI